MFTPLHIEKIDRTSHGRLVFRLSQPLKFVLDVDQGGEIEVFVPRGFETDFASVPQFFWRVFPPTGLWCEAAVLHDYLYSTRTCSRFLADALFREAMHVLGVPFWQRVAMYYAVRFFGGLFRRTA